MNETSNPNAELMRNLKEQVNIQMSTLTTKIPSYSELSEEEKKIVDNYISTIDLHNFL